MNSTERIQVHGVAFDLTTGPDGKTHVSVNGKRLPGHLVQDGHGGFRVSFIAKESFKKISTAVSRLAYWYTFDQYKKPINTKIIQWPDGTVDRVVTSQPDNALQLTLWQIEIKVEEARELIGKLSKDKQRVLGKHRVYKAEIGLKVHRAIELLFKVLLGKGVENDEWRFYGENKTHYLTLLHDKLETQDSHAVTRLDEVFQETVMVHDDPKFGEFLNPVSVEAGDGIEFKIMPREEITTPSARRLRDHLALMDMKSIYSQAYLGDAVQRISPAYLNYIADAEPFLDFLEKALLEVVMPSVRRLLVTELPR